MNNSRAIIVIIAVIVFFTILVGKLFDIQVLRSEELRYFAERQQTTTEKIKAERGLIYDRNNILLVYSRNDISFYLDLRMVGNSAKETIAENFSSVFGKSRKHYLSLMAQKGKTICIEKKAVSEKALQLKGLKIPGLFYKEDPTRVYHYDNFASHILGYVNAEYEAMNGVDRAYDEILKGEDGTMLVEKTAIGDMVTVAEAETKPAKPGNNLVLTIDKTYQTILEDELKAGIAAYGGSSAVGVLVDPNNGEILALANIDDYDPNRYYDYPDDIRKNRAVTDTYEPGSTFKSIAMAALLDQGLCNLNETLFVENGRYKYKTAYITDTHRSSYLTVRGIMEQSSNIGISKLIQRIDDDLLYKYYRGFGFGTLTTSRLPGEVKGYLKKPTEWSSLTKAFMSFGYELAVTPLQLALAYSALVNGGVLYQPQIVKREVDRNGLIVNEFSPVKVRTVISEETSALMREILVNIVDKGTAKNAKLKYIKAGGKTGTSQKLINGSYSKSEYNSSFAGFFPADEPKVVGVILVNSPKIGRYGGAVAAPIFKNIADKIVDSDFKSFESSPKQNTEEGNEIKILTVSNETNNSGRDSEPAVKKLKSIEGYTQTSRIMPDLTEYSLRDAIFILSKLGVKYKINGTGKIIWQSIPAGQKIKDGMSCTINLKEESFNGIVVY